MRSFATEEIELTSVSSKRPDTLGVELRSMIPGRRYAIHLTLPAGLPVGPFQGEVRIRTNSPKLAEIILPVEAVIAE